LTLIFGVVVIIAVVISVVGGYLIASRELRQEVDSFLIERSDTLIESLLSEMDAGGDSSTSFLEFLQTIQTSRALALLSSPVTVPYDIWMQISDGQNVLWFLRGEQPIPLQAIDDQIAQGEAPANFSTRSLSSSARSTTFRLRIYSFQLADGFSVQIGRDLRETETALNDLLYRTFLVSLIAMSVMSFIGWLVGRRIMRPIEKLAKRTDSITLTQDLSTPVEVRGGGEVTQLAESFNKMLVALNLSREQQQQFIADAGHELRTPLTSLRTNIELLASNMVEDPEERAELLNDMQLEVVEFVKIVEELIELSADPHLEEESMPVRLSEIAENIAERARRQTHRQIEVTVDNPIEVMGYAMALEKAVRNLVENALKFGSESEPVEILVTGSQLEVRDRGEGIPDQHLEKIFNRFYRSSEVQGIPGSGLGLAITRQIVERHRGQVLARNHPEGGAVVGFKLPPL